MINNLSICITTKNNQSTINECLNSIKDICNDIIFIDIGSTDSTVEMIKNHGYKLFPSISNNNTDNKNNLIKLSKKDWLFFIEPNEKIINGKNELIELCKGKDSVYSVLLVKNNILSKNIRIFNKNKNLFFENPIYENIYYKNSLKTGIALKEISELQLENEYVELIKWKENEKLKSYPLYYEACFYIKNKKYDNFLNAAEKYLFFEKNFNLPSYLMIKYYMSLIYFYIKKDFNSSIKNIVFCMEKNPTMAEFWCLLGDINFELKKYKKAFYFYENASIFGKFRSIDDDLPIEVDKYKTYPQKMKLICKEQLDKV